MLFMNLEQRPVLFEDVARQVLSRGKREQAQYYFDRIEAIREEDIRVSVEKNDRELSGRGGLWTSRRC